MFQTPAMFRVVSAVLAVVIGTTLMLAKVYFSAEYTRLATRGDVVVLPMAEVVGERPATNLAAAPGASRAN